MKTEGEYFFNSFDEAFNFVNAPTNYEKEHGIKIIGHYVRVNMDDLKVTERKTSDGRSMLILFFKNSTYYDIWKFWIPSANQMEFLKWISPLMVDYFVKINEGQK
jgi:hypothetical protein